jgi:glutamine---fructose-6-phosphate transaminase (isomerizing)
MCGIIGVLGKKQVMPILIDALKRLEYRGYDSAGIATVNEGHLGRRRAVGKLVNLSELLSHDAIAGLSGIGHTRWATHGVPSVANAHPHRAGPVAVVHNGIIENFRELRAELADRGIHSETETDTETVVLIAQAFLDEGMSPAEAARSTLKRLEGAFALAFLFEGENDLIVAARQGSPLAIGHGDGEMFVGSDAIALAPLTDRITYLEEGDSAVINRSRLEIRDASGKLTNRAIMTIHTDSSQVGKGGHKHFMAKEIAEQPMVLGKAVGHYLSYDGKSVAMPDPALDFTKYDRIIMIACGTAYYSCMTAKYWLEDLARLPVEIDVASEFRYREPPIDPRTLAVFVSQSGETADTLAALRYCQDKVSAIVSVVNVPESSIARESNVALPILAGAEIGVASTKAFTCQLVVLLMMALKAASDRRAVPPEEIANTLAALQSLPDILNLALEQSESIRQVAQSLSKARDVLYLGRGRIYPLALEGALKLKEISYIHAEAYASGELKHGPIALIDKNVPVVVMAPRDHLFEKTVSNMQEVMARNGQVLLITDQTGVKEAADGVWDTIVLPEVDPLLTPILYALPAQLLAYHAADALDADIDQPRNLAKSVTVE